MLISTFQPYPDVRFEGYGFFGLDYVAQEEGAASYQATTGNEIPPGEDGCYVVANRTEDGWIVGTDYWGMARLFTYEASGNWAVASSLRILVNHLKANGITLEPDIPTLKGLAIRHSLTNQIASRQTVIQGIELVPSYMALRLDAQGIHQYKIERPLLDRYEEALSEYIGLWTGRLKTILHDEESLLAADLSGGVDSRVVFSFLLSAGATDLGDERFRLVSNTKTADDFAPASNIAQTYGLELNGPPLQRRTSLNSGRALESWRNTSLGLYLPVYFVEQEFDPWSFQAHGAGGGNFRSPYEPGRGPIENLGRFKKYFDPKTFATWRGRAEADLERFAIDTPSIPPHIMHFRQFRSRMHFGHRSHRRPMFTPLNAAALDDVYSLAEGKPNRQVYFDVMESLAPGLMSLPYDSEKKSPGHDVHEAATRIAPRPEGKSGSIFAPLPEIGRDSNSPSAMTMWMEKSQSILEQKDVRDLMGEEALTEALAGIKMYRTQSKTLRANDPAMRAISFAHTLRFAIGD